MQAGSRDEGGVQVTGLSVAYSHTYQGCTDMVQHTPTHCGTDLCKHMLP